MKGLEIKLQKMIESLAELIESGQKLLKEEYEKALKKEGINVAQVEQLVDKMHRYMVSGVSMLEKVKRLGKDASEVDELIGRISYAVLQLDEEGRKRVIEVIENEFDRIRKSREY